MRWPWASSNPTPSDEAPHMPDKEGEPETVTKAPVPAVCSSASKTSKHVNEDAHCSYNGEHIGFVALADGVGSSPDCHVASRLAIETFDRHLRRLDLPGAHLSMSDVMAVWDTAAEAIQDHYRNAGATAYPTGSHPLETTLLFAIDLPECYVVSYVGNGSVWLVRGNYRNFLPRRWPWCITDLLIGHSSLSPQGVDVLYGALGASGLSSAPNTLMISKDRTDGELIILTTDGISSRDHSRIGEDPNHKLWQEVDPYIRALLENDLATWLRSAAQIPDKERSASLGGALEHFLNANTFDDDATVGALISGRVLLDSVKQARGG